MSQCSAKGIKRHVHVIRSTETSEQSDQSLRWLFYGIAKAFRVALADPEGGEVGPDPLPLMNHKNIGFLRYTGPVFNVGPSSARQRNADDGPLIVVFGSSLPYSTKKKKKEKTLPKYDPL